MAFELPPLPYPENALEPFISAKTLSFHYGKHHKAYVDKLNELAAGTSYEKARLTEVIQDTADASDAKKRKIFNNAAQVWNHTFFWNSMKREGGGAPPQGELARRIDSDLGGFDKFAATFKQTAVDQFGSGWAWLVLDGGKLKVVSTPNAVVPFVHGHQPLLTCDVWEHAYYLDYQNRRGDFVQAFLEHLVNWQFAEQQLSSKGEAGHTGARTGATARV